MFIRIELDDGSDHEWGFRSEVVPIIGDTLWLWCELPGEERTGNEHLVAKVIERIFPVEDFKDTDDPEVWIRAHSDEAVPDGFIADSPEWPSDDKGQYNVKRAMKIGKRN